MFKSSSHLDNPVFKETVLETLFEYVLLDDVPHPEVSLPQDALPKCSQEEIEAGYRLSWQMLARGVDLTRFRNLVALIAITGKANAEQRQEFKNVRAKFKHMRYACLNFDKKHRFPTMARIFTLLLGNMQDAFKNSQHRMTFLYGVVIWVMSLPILSKFITEPLLYFQQETPEGLHHYLQAENEKLAHFIKKDAEVTGHEFHIMRKFISRRTAFNDTLRTLRPSAHLHQLSEYLATINGMMGDQHDILVEKKLRGEQNYHTDHFQIPEDILRRLKEFLSQNGAL